ncbi:MAG: transaldolase family protein [Myxococcota bacterium]
MKFYLDSANIEEIREAGNLPFLSGITTNPTLLKKENIKNRIRFYENLLSIIPHKELFVQIFSDNDSDAYMEAIDLLKLSRERIVIKVPVTERLINTAYRLSDKGARICLTAVSNIRQIALSSLGNIEYCAIYLSRILKLKRDVYGEIAEQVEMLLNQKFKTRILVASIPDERLIEPLLRYPMLDYTLPYKPFMNLLRTEESEKWIKGFYEDSNEKTLKR